MLSRASQEDRLLSQAQRLPLRGLLRLHIARLRRQLPPEIRGRKLQSAKRPGRRCYPRRLPSLPQRHKKGRLRLGVLPIKQLRGNSGAPPSPIRAHKLLRKSLRASAAEKSLSRPYHRFLWYPAPLKAVFHFDFTRKRAKSASKAHQAEKRLSSSGEMLRVKRPHHSPKDSIREPFLPSGSRA